MSNSHAAAELAQRFAAIRSHYGRTRDLLKRSDEWGIDPYAWCAVSSGISLTPIEAAIWHSIRAENVVMYPQFPVGRFFVDFGNPVARVAIECDGKRWHIDALRDAFRQREIEAMGWSVYRITGRDCLTGDDETEGEDGVLTFQAGPGRELIQDIAHRHPVKRLVSSSAPLHILSALVGSND